jgi:hypothetical protein
MIFTGQLGSSDWTPTALPEVKKPMAAQALPQK